MYYLVLLGEDGDNDEKVAKHGQHRDTRHHVDLDVLYYPRVSACVLVMCTTLNDKPSSAEV